MTKTNLTHDDDGFEPEYCESCHRMVVDGRGKDTCRHHWLCGQGKFCKSCFDAGMVPDGLTGKPRRWPV
jgi:hypothetical protein